MWRFTFSKGLPLYRLPQRCGHLGSICFDGHFQRWCQHCSRRAARKTREVLAIQSIYKRYWIGEVESLAEHFDEGLSSEIACVGRSLPDRNLGRAVRVGCELGELPFKCSLRTV